LWQYLNVTGKIIILRTINSQLLGISSEFISGLIETGDERLKDYLPAAVYEHIRDKGLFGFASLRRQ
jgi:hypothetical protein